MTIRVLPADEYDRLDQFKELEGVLPPPQLSRVVVAEIDKEIVGYWIVQVYLLAEPAWIAPQFRGSTLGRRMFDEIERVIDEMGAERYMVHASDDKIGDYLRRLGLTNLNMVAYEGKLNGSEKNDGVR